jgi:hypothetical protein
MSSLISVSKQLDNETKKNKKKLSLPTKKKKKRTIQQSLLISPNTLGVPLKIFVLPFYLVTENNFSKELRRSFKTKLRRRRSTGETDFDYAGDRV